MCSAWWIGIWNLLQKYHYVHCSQQPVYKNTSNQFGYKREKAIFREKMLQSTSTQHKYYQRTSLKYATFPFLFLSCVLLPSIICLCDILIRIFDEVCDPLFAHIHFISGKLNLYSLNVCFRQLYGFYLFGFVLPALLLCTSSFSFLLPFSIFLDVYSQSVCFSLSLAHPHQLP